VTGLGGVATFGGSARSPDCHASLRRLARLRKPGLRVAKPKPKPAIRGKKNLAVVTARPDRSNFSKLIKIPKPNLHLSPNRNRRNVLDISFRCAHGFISVLIITTVV
jgi:hypothetical protein